MDIVAAAKTAAKVAKGAEKVARQVKKWIEVDQNTRIVVLRDVVLGRFRDPVIMPDKTERHIQDFFCPDFEIRDRVFTFYKTGDRDPICDGSTYCPDRIRTFDTIKAALGHDGLYQYLKEIAEAWGWTEDEVRWLADAVFGLLADAEADRQKSAAMRAFGHAFSKVGYAVVRLFGGIYHRSRNAVLLAALALFPGCIGIPDVFEPSDDQPEYRSEVVQNAPAQTAPAQTAPAQTGADMVDFAGLSWPYGGFKGGSAALHPGCEIADLRVTSKGLSYRWARGGCEALGAADRGDHSRTLACFFVRGVDGKWRGGKIDWISTSRTIRDFNNIRSGYGGWPKDAIETAQGYAFAIVSKDGKRRTNVITCGR